MKVQLANTYNPSKNYKTASWYATPKFDGIRAVFIPNKGFFTRNEKPIAGFGSMVEILDDVCNREGRPVFVLGLPYKFDIDAYCAGAVFPEE